MVGVRLMVIRGNILGCAAELLRKAAGAVRCGGGMEVLKRRNAGQRTSRATLDSKKGGPKFHFFGLGSCEEGALQDLSRGRLGR
jgi:hypothetical protein